MDPELITVLVIVAGAAVYLSRRTWQTWSGKKAGCGNGCNCSGKKAEDAPKLIPSEHLTLRLTSQADPLSRH
jgi:hypothetical protein